MSLDATIWAWKQRDITPTEKLILLSFADRAGETHEAWPSWDRLIDDTGLDRKSIYYGLLGLQKKGKMIKTGSKVKRCHIYKLLGVKGREECDDKNISSKNGTNKKKNISSKNGTHISSKNGTNISSKNGTKNLPRNLQRNLQGETLSFSSFSDFKSFVSYVEQEVTATGKQPVNALVEEVLYTAEKWKEKKDPVESVKMAVIVIKQGKWKTPHGFKGFSSKTVKEKEEQDARKKENQIQQDAVVGRMIKKAVNSNNREMFSKMVREMSASANQG